MTHLLNGIAPLPHLGVIRVEGEDAAAFLQGQLTQDFMLLGAGQARLAAFCSAKGRVQASFVGFKPGPAEIVLVCSRDILGATLKRLSMFVLRAKAKLTDASEQFQLWGVAGDAMNSMGGAAAPWSRVEQAAASLITLYPADGQPRGLWIAPVAEAAPGGPALSHALWMWGEIRSGVATVSAPLVDALVPQMLNYESVGGVNFKKGCYPGQEIVARSQFRGTLRRRAYVAHCPAALTAGQELFHAADASQPCGLVVQAAESPDAGFEAIVSMQISAADGAGLAVGTPEGAPVTLRPLPYLLLADV